MVAALTGAVEGWSCMRSMLLIHGMPHSSVCSSCIACLQGRIALTGGHAVQLPPHAEKSAKQLICSSLLQLLSRSYSLALQGGASSDGAACVEAEAAAAEGRSNQGGVHCLHVWTLHIPPGNIETCSPLHNDPHIGSAFFFIWVFWQC
jgi:hypothetical protein